jgi:GNAT superfamily N-acetyltransferase
MRPDEADAVCAMISRVFDEFVGYEYTRAGVRAFYAYANPQKMVPRLGNGNFVLVARHQAEIVGMIEFRNYDHLSLLFVDKQFHRRGISRRLLTLALEICRIRRPDVNTISVNSSRYAAPVYQKLGFDPTGPKKTIDGITFVPMILHLTHPTNLEED